MPSVPTSEPTHPEFLPAKSPVLSHEGQDSQALEMQKLDAIKEVSEEVVTSREGSRPKTSDLDEGNSSFLAVFIAR